MRKQGIYFANMWEGHLEEYASRGFQRAQYYLGKSLKGGRYSSDMTRDPEKLEKAEKWLLAAIRNPGIDPDEKKQRGDRKKFEGLAKDALSEMYCELAWRNKDRNSFDRYNPKFSDTGMQYVLKVIELGVNPYFMSTVAMQYLRGGIPHLGEGNTGERGRKFAIDLLVNAAHTPRTEAVHHLNEIYKDTGGLDIQVALGKAKVISSYQMIEKGRRGYLPEFEGGFKLLEDVGNYDKNGNNGLNMARDALNFLESIARQAVVDANRERLHSLRVYTKLGDEFRNRAEALKEPIKTNALLDRVIKARQFIETSKLGDDADFEVRAAPA